MRRLTFRTGSCWPSRTASLCSRLARQDRAAPSARVLCGYGDWWYWCIGSVGSETGAWKNRTSRLVRPEATTGAPHVRYPLSLPLRYKVLHGCRPFKTRDGRTGDLSSSGVRFVADGPLQPGNKIEVAVDWPLKLHAERASETEVSGYSGLSQR